MSTPATPATVTGLLLAQAASSRPGLLFEGGVAVSRTPDTPPGDLGPKQHPRFVRVASQIPRTATFKALTRVLAADRWNTSDPVWWRPDGRGPSPAYVLLDAEQATALDAEIGARPGR